MSEQKTPRTDGLEQEMRDDDGWDNSTRYARFEKLSRTLETELSQARGEVERLKEGEKWAASMFCQILVEAIKGFADCAIIAHQEMGAEHSIAAVKQCAEEAKRLRAENASLVQTTGDLCEVCGWRVVIPSIGCLNCEHGKLNKENAELRAKLSTL